MRKVNVHLFLRELLSDHVSVYTSLHVLCSILILVERGEKERGSQYHAKVKMYWLYKQVKTTILTYHHLFHLHQVHMPKLAWWFSKRRSSPQQRVPLHFLSSNSSFSHILSQPTFFVWGPMLSSSPSRLFTASSLTACHTLYAITLLLWLLSSLLSLGWHSLFCNRTIWSGTPRGLRFPFSPTWEPIAAGNYRSRRQLQFSYSFQA